MLGHGLVVRSQTKGFENFGGKHVSLIETRVKHFAWNSTAIKRFRTFSNNFMRYTSRIAPYFSDTPLLTRTLCVRHHPGRPAAAVLGSVWGRGGEKDMNPVNTTAIFDAVMGYGQREGRITLSGWPVAGCGKFKWGVGAGLHKHCVCTQTNICTVTQHSQLMRIIIVYLFCSVSPRHVSASNYAIIKGAISNYTRRAWNIVWIQSVKIFYRMSLHIYCACFAAVVLFLAWRPYFM
jgi:hypothetical protein